MRFGAAGWGVAGAVAVVGAVGAAILLGGTPDEGTATPGGSGAARSTAAPFGGTDGALDLPSVGTDAPTSAAPSTSAVPQPTGDLHVGVPMSSPACDSTWVVFLGATLDPANVSRLMAGRPDAKYLLTRGGCSSMRQQLPDGSPIYAVYVGPYPDQAAACAARSAIGGNAYVKRMDNSTPPEQMWTC